MLEGKSSEKIVLCFLQIIQIAPMPVVQTNVHPSAAAAVHPGSPFPVSMATVMAPGAAPPQTVLLTSPPTRSLTHASHLKDSSIRAALVSSITASAGQRSI